MWTDGSSAVIGPVILNSFVVSDYYWTSTTDVASATQAWKIYGCDFGVYIRAKTDVRYALAVEPPRWWRKSRGAELASRTPPPSDRR